MAEWKIDESSRKSLNKLISEASVSSKDATTLKTIAKKAIVTYEDITNIKDKLPDDVPVFAFFNKLPLNYEDHTYKASEDFRKKTEILKLQQDQDSYKRLVRSIDPAQKYGKIDHMENFGAEMKTVNRQMMSVVNVIITVVGSFFFGFSGVTYAYPHLKLDLATRFLIGLIPATIVFFADLYFVVKGMDMDEYADQPKDLPKKQPSGNTFSFKNMEDKKND
ncbi:unnamed protein product [Caenorhabditis angaria]|uniref:Transmembrane protein 199 n=1 Tax=Caenorhabditis angaria TaxID=860376 RepID=A0A9P1IC48_9PELO|nr:unnamed protein product [Caenorhabditis angaria]